MCGRCPKLVPACNPSGERLGTLRNLLRADRVLDCEV
jgi:hypothetical protein